MPGPQKERDRRKKQEVEKTKKAGKNSAGIKPDKGYIGHKAAKMMKRSQCMVDRKNEAILTW